MMGQLLAHLWGDYLLQSDWMALNKRKHSAPAVVHAFCYTLCFYPLIYFSGATHSRWCAVVIFMTHLLIDRFGLARYVVWAKNWMGPSGNLPWRLCSSTGYAATRPEWLTMWLLIIADNTLHLTCNYVALRWL